MVVLASSIRLFAIVYQVSNHMLCSNFFLFSFIMPILINGTMLRWGMASRDFNSHSDIIFNWFSIIKKNKKNTKQTKLPKEITQGASVAVDENGNPIKHLNFNRKPKPTKPATAKEIKPNSKQKKLFEE